jgi:hypothetical protein
VRGRDLSCKVETPCVRQRLLVRGGDLLEKPLTSWRLIGGASNKSETRRLASDGLGDDPQSSSH